MGGRAREIQLEGRAEARLRDDESYPVYKSKGSWEPIGWVNTEGVFITNRSLVQRRAYRLDWLGNGTIKFRQMYVKVMRMGRMYGINLHTLP